MQAEKEQQRRIQQPDRT